MILVPPFGAEGLTLVDAFCELISVAPSALATLALSAAALKTP